MSAPNAPLDRDAILARSGAGSAMSTPLEVVARTLVTTERALEAAAGTIATALEAVDAQKAALWLLARPEDRDRLAGILSPPREHVAERKDAPGAPPAKPRTLMPDTASPG